MYHGYESYGDNYTWTTFKKRLKNSKTKQNKKKEKIMKSL